MRYIGPFFRMNNLSKEDIEGQLFFLSRESIKTLVLNSKCGILSSLRNSKNPLFSNDNISILKNFSPLICIYRKASPVFIHNKTSMNFDESTFKKDIIPSTNALMTMSLLELSDYYSNYSKNNRNIDSLEKTYSALSKEQLEFYYENLRNPEGIFTEKKNISEGNSKGYNLIDKNKKFDFLNQALMMDAYFMYYYYNKDDDVGSEYKNFSLEILQMFIDFKDALYELSFNDCTKILFAFNIFYEYSKNEDSKTLIIDITDFLINKFEEKDYFTSSLDSCALFALVLEDSYKHTSIVSFKEKSDSIYEKLKNLYDPEKGLFIKLVDKKEIKYSSIEICLYFLSMLNHSTDDDNSIEYKSMISSLYKRYFITSGLVSSWPEAPTLDETERYRGLSLHSEDMLDESYFRMPNLPSPNSSGTAPVFVKGVTYSRKKNSFSKSKDSFDSNKNLFIFFIFIHYLSPDVSEYMNFNKVVEVSKDEVIQEPTPIEDLKPVSEPPKCIPTKEQKKDSKKDSKKENKSKE